MTWKGKIRAVFRIGGNVDVEYWLVDCYQPALYKGFMDIAVPAWNTYAGLWLPGVFMWIPALQTQLPLFLIN